MSLQLHQMVTGAILEKGENRYTYLKKLFVSMGHFQKNYNWLITDCEACPEKQGHRDRIVQSKDGRYAWIGGEELTNIVRKDNFQWIWAVLSGFDRQISKEAVLKYKLPYADGYKGFWDTKLALQHPLAEIELVAWDGCCTLLLSRNAYLTGKFREAFPNSEDLEEYNRRDRS